MTEDLHKDKTPPGSVTLEEYYNFDNRIPPQLSLGRFCSFLSSTHLGAGVNDFVELFLTSIAFFSSFLCSPNSSLTSIAWIPVFCSFVLEFCI
jgi:hypothetical protein